jgi:hypothetical protein
MENILVNTPKENPMDKIISLKQRKISKATSNKTTEYCAICWGKTGVKKTDRIELRNYFVEGVGQLCPSCYRDLYVIKS